MGYSFPKGVTVEQCASMIHFTMPSSIDTEIELDDGSRIDLAAQENGLAEFMRRVGEISAVIGEDDLGMP
jgi:hypothetical protein